MTGHSENDYEYDDDFVAGLEWVRGEGFLSLGGPEEIAAITRGLDLAGKRLLDIGSTLARREVVELGDLRPTHFRGFKPGA